MTGARRRLRRLRRSPVARSEAHGGFWVLARHAEVTAAAGDWQTFSSAEGVVHPLPPGHAVRQVALEQDPPEHTAFRRLYQELLSRERVRALLKAPSPRSPGVASTSSQPAVGVISWPR